MDPSQIDSLILSAVREHWTKVAMVIARIAKTMNPDLLLEEQDYEAISRRIESLVHAGRLEAQGNTKNWRFSEIRLRAT